MTKLTLTADGSHTLELEGVGEHYHSTEGAIEEARHVYLRQPNRSRYSRWASAQGSMLC